MVRVLLLATLLVKTNTWLLKSTHSSIIPGLTDDVKLNCSQAEKDLAVKSNVDPFRLRLQKQTEGDKWNTYASLDKSNIITHQLNMSGVVVEGYLGKENETYLSVTWSTARQDTVGSYICNVDAKDEESGNFVNNITKTVRITKNDKPSILQLVKTVVDLENKMDVTDRMIREHLNAIQGTFSNGRYWPKGKYTLLSPGTGCPSTPYSYLPNGHFGTNTYTLSKYNFSFPSHLHDDTYVRTNDFNYINFRFCRFPEISSATEWNVRWPKGDYCIGVYDGAKNCGELGFTIQFLGIDLLNKAYAVSTWKYVKSPLKWGSQQITFYFCCRHDSDAKMPILLPNKKPFYLYRIRKDCQSVLNMDVTKERFHLEGKPFASYRLHPSDVAANTNLIYVNLCYYSPKKM